MANQGSTGKVPRPRGARPDGRRRRAPARRRAELLDAALAVFAERGFEHATLQEVADRAGVTKGGVYHYFDSKEALLLELMRERLVPAVAGREQLVDSATGTRDEVLRELIGRIWRQLQAPGQIELARIAMTELPKYPELGRILFDEVARRGRQTLRRALERGVERGELRPDVTEEVVAVIPYMIMGVALGRHLFHAMDSARLDAERGEEVVAALLLRGVGRTCAERATRCPAASERRDAG
jgi:AcrR family transcriptional regulator